MSETTPSVLAILVVSDGASWVRRSLAGLSRQTHGRIGVLAVDNASTDGSAEILQGVLGRRRCLRLPENVGLAGAVARALQVPAAAEADYVLLLHDDTTLAPDAVERMVETARRVRGAGVVAPKVLDAARPDTLLEIGHAADRFGYPYSPLEEGEIDQGQYDAPREVLFVSSVAMLVSREVLDVVAPFDERLWNGQPELDFCWRARLAGFRVLVDPRAVATHGLAGERGERPGFSPEGRRYLGERVGFLALLKNYRLLTLLWVLPVYTVQVVGRFFFYLLSRHGGRSLEVARAWGWNVAHLPGTLRRRFRAQRSRRVRDREIVRFMAPVGARLQRWALQASSLLVARRAAHVEDEEEPEAPPLPRRVASVAAAHPVAIAWLIAAVAIPVAFRDVLFAPRIEGGSLGVLPEGPLVYLREFGARWRTTGFGGPGGASPALVVLGAGSFLSLGDPMLLVRLLVSLSPALAAISAYFAVVRLTREAGPAMVAAASYALSAVALWTASEGSLPAMALLLATPWLALRLADGFGRDAPRGPLRWIVATAVVVAVAGSFFPAILVTAALFLVPLILIPERGGNPLRGLALGVLGLAGAAILVFPYSLQLASAAGGAAVGAAGRADFSSLLRLSPGGAPGSGIMAFFLPVAGVISYAFAEGHARWATRALFVASLGIPLAWLAAAGHLPPPAGNPLAYLVPAAFALSLLVGLGMRGLVAGLRRTAFGVAQLGVAVTGAVLAVGLTFQLFSALGGGWAVGERRHPPAWPVVASAEPGRDFRVLWLGQPDGGRFPPPGGVADGLVEAGAASVRYGVTGRGGRSLLGLGIPPTGAPYDRLEHTLRTVLSGDVRHGGALLAPFGIHYVVGGEQDLPETVAERLALQLDLDLVQSAGGLRIYRNAKALPSAAAFSDPEAMTALRSGALLAPTSLAPDEAVALEPGGGVSWSGGVGGSSTVLASIRFDEGWTVEGGDVFPAFGWAVGALAPGSDVSLRFEGGPAQPLQLGGMALLWALALWVVLRPARPREEAPPPARAVRNGTRVPAGAAPGPAVSPGRRP